VSQLLSGEENATSLLRIVSGVAAKTTAVMPLILAGLLALVSLVGIMTMRSPATADHSGSGGRDRGTSITTDPGGEALTDHQDDGAFEGGRPPPAEPQSDENPSYDSQDLEATDSAPNVDGDDSEAPGKSEEAPGHPRAPGQSKGRGQEKADENGQGPINGRDNSSTRRN
jgi:hypothetical protein